MKTLLSLSRTAKIWSAIALVGIVGQPVLPPAASAGQPVREIEAVNPDVDHTGILRIGYNEKLPVTRHVMIGLDKSMVVELPRSLKDVVVSNPMNLDAVVQTSNRVFLIAKKIGDANVFFYDENGEQIMTLEVRVERDMQPYNRLIERLIPGSHINAEIINDTIVLSGTVINPADSARASEIAARVMVKPDPQAPPQYTTKVINLLRVEAKEQVMLKVTIAEVSRELIKRIGLNLAGGTNGSQLATNNGFSDTAGGANSFFSGVLGSQASCILPGFGKTIAPGSSAVLGGVLKSVGALLPAGGGTCLGYTAEAFEHAGLVKILAEPSLTAISGETASFLAGGEFPVPTGGSTTNGLTTTTIEFKPFGVRLSFTPLVESEGQITLKIATENSDLSTKGAIVANGISIPALSVRRANTTVDLPSGGSMVIGGLISDNTQQAIEGVPGLKNLPILGALFRSRDFLKEESELVVVVTPYIVSAVARSKVALPTDGLDPATDKQAEFLGQINRVYGHHEKTPEGEYLGKLGFIVE